MCRGRCPHRPAGIVMAKAAPWTVERFCGTFCIMFQLHRRNPSVSLRLSAQHKARPSGAFSRKPRYKKASPERGGGPAKLVEGFTREVYFLGLPCRNRPAEFARFPRCPPVARQRRLLPLPVLVMLIFRCFPVQTVNLIFYGVCKLVEGFTREV